MCVYMHIHISMYVFIYMSGTVTLRSAISSRLLSSFAFRSTTDRQASKQASRQPSGRRAFTGLKKA